MSDLVEFLRARIAEDERTARATTGPWKYHRETGGVVLAAAGYVPELSEIISTPRKPSDARHMVRWDSARVLAEIKAKRRIVQELSTVTEWNWPSQSDGAVPMEYVEALRHVLKLHALPYAEHPDYDEAWRP